MPLPPPKPRDKPTDEISRIYGVGKRQARNIRKNIIANGHALTEDQLAAIAKLEPIQKQKLQKLIVETDLSTEKLKIVRRDHIPIEEVRSLGIKIGSSISELAGEAISNWPGELAGRNEIQIREHLTQVWKSFIEQFRATMRKI